MVLGRLRTKKQKDQISVDYLIEVKQINPWNLSQSQKSAESVFLQWEGGNKSSGSLSSDIVDEKINFNESFRLPVTLTKESSKKGTASESFQKNWLEFYLYESRKDKATKQIGSATINLADYGVIEEMVTISIPVYLKKSSKSAMQPVLYICIRPTDDKGSSNSSPNGNLPEDASLVDEDDEDDDEIAYFTDDDSASVQSSQTPASTIEATTRPNEKKRTESVKDSIEAPYYMDPDLLSGAAVSPSDENPVAESLKYGNKSSVQDRDESARDSADTIRVEPAQRLGVSGYDVDKKLIAESSEYQNNSSSTQSTVDVSSFRKIVERRKKAADVSAIIRKTAQQSKRDNGTVSRAAKEASSFPSAEVIMNSDSLSSSKSQTIQEDYTKAGRQSIDLQMKTTSILGIDLLENKKKIELQKNGQDKQETGMKDYLPEDEPLSELSQSTKKEISSRSKTITPSRNADQGNIATNDNIKHVRSRQVFSDSAKSNIPSRNKELRVRSKENGIPEGSRNGSKSPTATEIKGIKNNFSDSKDGLKSENEMLKEELKEAAAVEIALYSVVAEHGNSANKVHAPACRLARLYFHACKAGSRSKMAGAARTSISGLILVSRACGNDVPRLTFWLSNSIVLRATVCQASRNLLISVESDTVNNKFSTRNQHFNEKEQNNSMKCFENWENIHTFIAALEKVEAWIFSRIVESVWWQTLTPYMQSAAAKNSSSRKTDGKKHTFGDPEQVNFSIDLWKKAFKDACERLCPLRAEGLQCGCLPILARLVMEQLVNRLDVAMFNAILRDSAEDMPTDPMSDPISDPKVLPVPAGKTSFGAGAQLKNSIGNWSRWLTDIFGIDDDPSEDYIESNVDHTPEPGTSFKPFYLLKSLSDLLMLPFDLLADGSTRQEVCPSFGAQMIKTVLTNFVPDEFCPDRVPESIFEFLDSEAFLEEGQEYITSVPCSAAPTAYSPPKAASLKYITGEVGDYSPCPAKGASLLRKAYTSDDELDELDSPIKSISIDSIRVNPRWTAPKSTSKGKGHRKAVRYQLLREVWKDEN